MAGKKIVIGIDFSEQSYIAMEQSFNLARQLSAEVVLMHFSSFARESKGFKDASKKLADLGLEMQSKVGLSFTPSVLEGDLLREMPREIENLKPEFVFLGVSEKSRQKNKKINSTALQIIKEVKCPVFSIKGKQHFDGCRNIILPLDLSKQTRDKIKSSIQLAKIWNSAVNTVSVIHSYDDFLINKLSRQLAKIKEIFDENEIESTAEIIKGTKGEESAAEMIVSYAHKAEGDLILIMTQQEGIHNIDFLGSTAEELITLSDIPVITIVPFDNLKA